MYLLGSRSVSQHLLGVSKANVLIDNRARMLRREEKACQHVKQDKYPTIHHDDNAIKIRVPAQRNDRAQRPAPGKLLESLHR
ncbi:hypothetical protein CLM71_00870 [Serratia sp. MYb239]|nr:hypothetical protein CLM71_00870 [Serratia sp. MYb239]